MNFETKIKIIIIYEKKKQKFADRTEDIETLLEDGNLYKIKFKDNEKTYNYSKSDVIIVDNLEKLDIDNKIIYSNTYKCFYNLKEVWDCGDFLNIVTENQKSKKRISEIYYKNEIYIYENRKNDYKSLNFFDYLINVANSIDNDRATLLNEDNLEDDSFIVKQIAHLKYTEDSFLYNFFNNKIKCLKPNNRNSNFEKIPYIHPFGTNKAQMQAVENVFQNNFSIIQGPPGTGKTNTILNIISNVINANKTVAVVSNNNTAVDNIEDKLKESNQNFFTARLGKKDLINDFFKNQYDFKTNFCIKYLEENKLINIVSILNEHIIFVNSINSNKFCEKTIKVNECKPSIINEKILKILNFYENKLKKTWKSELKIPELQQKIEDLKLEWEAKKLWFNNANENDYKIIKKVITNSDKILELIAAIEYGNPKKVKTNNPRKFYRLRNKLFFWHKFKIFNLKKHIKNVNETVLFLENEFYKFKLNEYLNDIAIEKKKINNNKFKIFKTKHQQISQLYFTWKLITNYENLIDNMSVQKIDSENYKDEWSTFINFFPVVLSTTHSLMQSSNEVFLYDYLIIDESSQVDVTTALLSFSKAKNVVLVGDLKQLQHVVTEKKDKQETLNDIFEKFLLNVKDEDRSFYTNLEYKNNSILKASLNIFEDRVNKVFLNEHYRCDPQIINFCNKRFYNDKLVIRTKHREGYGIFIETLSGDFEWNKTNEREARIIKHRYNRLIENNEDKKEIGIMSPFVNQVKKIESEGYGNEIVIETTHKFQGKEKNNIIYSIVKNKNTKFINNPNLINVGISRAKNKLYIIGNEEVFQEKNTIWNDLNNYFKYNQIEHQKTETSIYSVFDLMYKNYHSKLRELGLQLMKVSKFPTENIFMTILEQVLVEEFDYLSYYFNHPINKVIDVSKITSKDDYKFAINEFTHCDFILFNKVTKKYLLVFEIDGRHHKNNKKQIERDKMKDRLLSLYNLKPIRIEINNIIKDKKLKEFIKNAIRTVIT